MDKILLIILVNLVFFFKTLRYGFVSDDEFRVQETKKDIINPVNIIKSLFGKVILNSEVEHLLSLLVHTVTCIMIYFAFGMNSISLMASLLFAVNPATYQGGIWISGRGYALSTIAILLAMIMGNWGIIPYALS